MGIQERKERERDERRKTILRTAKKIIKKSGVEGMSMNLLAETTELNKATLYLYFSNKDDLIDAIVYEGLLLLEKIFSEADRPTLTGLQRILSLVHITFDFYKGHPVYFYTLNHQERRRVTERTETPFAEKGNQVASTIFEKISEGLLRGKQDGSIRKTVDPDPFLVLFFAQLYGVMHMIYTKEDVYVDVLGMTSDQIKKTALDWVEYYLKSVG